MLFIYINFVVFNENQILLLYFSLKVRQQVYCGDKKNITPNQLKCISNLQTAQWKLLYTKKAFFQKR